MSPPETGQSDHRSTERRAVVTHKSGCPAAPLPVARAGASVRTTRTGPCRVTPSRAASTRADMAGQPAPRAGPQRRACDLTHQHRIASAERTQPEYSVASSGDRIARGQPYRRVQSVGRSPPDSAVPALIDLSGAARVTVAGPRRELTQRPLSGAQGASRCRDRDSRDGELQLSVPCHPAAASPIAPAVSGPIRSV